MLKRFLLGLAALATSSIAIAHYYLSVPVANPTSSTSAPVTSSANPTVTSTSTWYCVNASGQAITGSWTTSALAEPPCGQAVANDGITRYLEERVTTKTVAQTTTTQTTSTRRFEIQGSTQIKVSDAHAALINMAGGTGVTAVGGGGDASCVNGGVNWADTLAYPKPPCIDITFPDLASAPTYYVDLSSGSGSTCSMASPCGDMADLCGKTGFSGGPALVYVRGTGSLYIYNPSGQCHGSAGNEIVIRPWPGSTATFVGGSTNNLTGSNLHHWIFDGGVDMGITFQTADDNNDIALRPNSDDHTFYRIRGTCNNNSGGEIFMTSDGSQAANLRIINSEFYNCKSGNGSEQQSAVYMGGDSCTTGSAGFSNFQFENNIVRSFGGEGMELNPRSAAVGATITGNVFRDVGLQTCGGGWDCRPAVTIDGPSCGGSSSNVVVANNTMWNIGGSCIWSKGGGTGSKYLNNTCYDFGQDPGNGACVEGICGTTQAEIRNNIIVSISPNNHDPFGNSYTTNTNNMCASGTSCGTSSQTFNSSTTLLSLVEDDSNHLRVSPSGSAKGNGADTTADVAVDFDNTARSVPVTIGAFQ